jgi:hypothetical protein
VVVSPGLVGCSETVGTGSSATGGIGGRVVVGFGARGVVGEGLVVGAAEVV